MNSEKYSGIGFSKESVEKMESLKYSFSSMAIYNAFEDTSITSFALTDSLMSAFQAFRVLKFELSHLMGYFIMFPCLQSSVIQSNQQFLFSLEFL